MRDALTMRGVERVRDLCGNGERLCEWDGSFGQPRSKRVAFEVFDDDVVGVALAANVVQNADVRVIQVRDSVGLTLEPLTLVWPVGEVSTKYFDGNDATEACIARAIHLL